MSQKNTKVSGEDRQKVLSFFMLGFPSLLIAAIGIAGRDDLFSAFLSILLVFYQLVVLKQFIDRYYEVL